LANPVNTQTDKTEKNKDTNRQKQVKP